MSMSSARAWPVSRPRSRSSSAGSAVTLHESGPAAGGRCRSYFDRELGCRIDNGNHLLLSGNRAAHRLPRPDRLGRHARRAQARRSSPSSTSAPASAGPCGPIAAGCRSGSSAAARRVPGTRAGRLPAAPRAAPRRRRGHRRRDAAARHAVSPPAGAARHRGAQHAARHRQRPAARRRRRRQPGARRQRLHPRLSRPKACPRRFIDPALAWLERTRRHHPVRQPGRRASSTSAGPRRGSGRMPIGADEAVVLAVPAPVATACCPASRRPTQFEAILNVHFRIDADPGEAGFVGIVGGTAEWVFVKPGVVSVTISAGEPPAGDPRSGPRATSVARCAHRAPLA